MSDSGYLHEALFYADDGEYLAGTVPLLREGLEGGDPMLVAVAEEKGDSIRSELGEDASGIEFADMAALGRNPGRIISVWREFLDRAPVGSHPRGIGEPAWPGRSLAELDECRRHEALLNVAFADARSFTLLCPYDSGALDERVLDHACGSHPTVLHGGGEPAPGRWGERQADFAPFAGRLPGPPRDALAIRFQIEHLATVRESVAEQATLAGLAPERVSDMVVAVNELVGNSVVHGGGGGTARIWLEPDALVAEVEDAGRIEEPLVGRLRPGVGQDGGRGLWIAHQLCDLVQVRSGPLGTRVRVRVNLP